MGLVTYEKECMFFVGGNASKSTNPTGSAYAGGCTTAWWLHNLCGTITVSGDLKVATSSGGAITQPGPTGEYVWASTFDSSLVINEPTNEPLGWYNGVKVYESVDLHPDGLGGTCKYYLYYDFGVHDCWRISSVPTDWNSYTPRWYKATNPVDIVSEGGSLDGFCTTACSGTAVIDFDIAKVGDIGYEATATAAMGKLMGSGGETIVSLYGSLGEECFLEDNGSGYTRIWDGTALGAFAGSEIGMLVYLEDTDSCTGDGSGIYEIIDIDQSGYWFDIDTPFYGVGGDLCDVHIGGGWNNIDSLCENYVDADLKPQNVWVNKDLTINAQWNWGNWGCGNILRNTRLQLIGFNTVPGDTTDQAGLYYQSINDAKVNGVHPDKSVAINLNMMASQFIDPAGCKNIRMSGFRTYNQASNQWILKYSTATIFTGVEFSRNFFNLNNHGLNFCYGKCGLALENYFYTTTVPAGTALYAVEGNSTTTAFIAFNYFDLKGKKVVNVQADAESIFLLGNVGYGEYVTTNCCGAGSFNVMAFNTWLDANTGLGAIRVTGGFLMSLSNIIRPKTLTQAAFEISGLGGTTISRNDCVFAADGNLAIFMQNLYSGGQLSVKESTLEVDPLLDVCNRPHNNKVLLGGPVDISNQKTTIGGVSQDHKFVGRSNNSNPGRLGITR